MEVKIAGVWQRMRHTFDRRDSAETIAHAARGARDVEDARVVEIVDQ